MRTWLARHLFYPAQDRLCGRRSLGSAQRLDESQWLGTTQLEDLQWTKLRRLLGHALLNVPFYREHFGEIALDLAHAGTLEDLSKLPVLTKDDIRAHREHMIDCSRRGSLTRSCTSGSTGSPLIFNVCNRREQSDIAGRIRAHSWFDIHPGDPAVYLWGSPIESRNQDRLRALRDWLINERLLSAFTLTDQRLHRYANYVFRVRPVWIYSYASSLWRFAQFVRDRRPELKGAVRRVAFASGEQLLAHWRDEIVQALECSVAEEYGCREGGLIAHECPQGSYHIMAENVIVEILDHDDGVLPPGTEGRIVITNLEAYGMPFIRYDTGDRGALRTGKCPCGRGLPMMDRPTGRTFEMLETDDGTRITGVSVSRDLKEVDGIAHYRVIQEARGRVHLLVVPNSRYDAGQAEAVIIRIFRGRLGLSTAVRIEYVDELPAHASGKYRYVVNAIGQYASPHILQPYSKTVLCDLVCCEDRVLVLQGVRRCGL